MDDVTERVRAAEHRPVSVAAHPGWCDPGRCDRVDGGVAHRSEPVVLRTVDARLSLAWVRWVEADAQQSGVTELRIDVDYEAAPGVGAQLFLTPWEVGRFGRELLRCCWRERCGRPLVVRSAGVVTS